MIVFLFFFFSLVNSFQFHSIFFFKNSNNFFFFIQVNTSSAWVLDADDLVEDDIVNEDELLTEEDLVKPDTKAYDCGTSASGARKACKGCVCGLAEELEQENATIKKKTPAQASACGNCSLGDAFRCASCPYLGQPAFKPGEEVLLDI